MAQSGKDLDPRRKRLRFRAWHRGTREMDLILGRFIDQRIGDLSLEELDAMEALMEVPDPDLYAWVTGERPVPGAYDLPLFRRLAAFHAGLMDQD